MQATGLGAKGYDDLGADIERLGGQEGGGENQDEILVLVEVVGDVVMGTGGGRFTGDGMGVKVDMGDSLA